MLSSESSSLGAGLDLSMVALQDELLIATTDLGRLRELLDHAVAHLIDQFGIASSETQKLQATDPLVASRIASALDVRANCTAVSGSLDPIGDPCDRAYGQCFRCTGHSRHAGRRRQSGCP